MPNIRSQEQPVTQITIVECEPDKQAEALSVLTSAPASWQATRHLIRTVRNGNSANLVHSKVSAG